MLRELTNIIGESQTLAEAFKALDGVEILVDNKLGSSYTILSPRKEFVILEDNGEDRTQFLHLYGTRILYYVSKVDPKS